MKSACNETQDPLRVRFIAILVPAGSIWRLFFSSYSSLSYFQTLWLRDLYWLLLKMGVGESWARIWRQLWQQNDDHDSGPQKSLSWHSLMFNVKEDSCTSLRYKLSMLELCLKKKNHELEKRLLKAEHKFETLGTMWWWKEEQWLQLPGIQIWALSRKNCEIWAIPSMWWT